MQYKVGKPVYTSDDTTKPCKGYNRPPCSIVHIELVTSWPVTILWILLSWLVSTLATTAYVHPEWFVREHNIRGEVLTYDRQGLMSTLGMVSVCYREHIKDSFRHDVVKDIYHQDVVKSLSVVKDNYKYGVVKDSYHQDRQDVGKDSYQHGVVKDIYHQDRQDIAEDSYQHGVVKDTYHQDRQGVVKDSYQHGAAKVYDIAKSSTHQDVKSSHHQKEGVSKEEMECHNFEEDFPSGSWQASYVLFGSGCVLLTWCSILAFCNVWIVGRKNRQLVATLIGRIQLVAAVLQAISLLLFPLVLGSSFAKLHCGSESAPYAPTGCRVGWAYIAAIASTLLACYCPLLAHFSHYNIFSPCLWTEI